jgi:hypothetical protein
MRKINDLLSLATILGAPLLLAIIVPLLATATPQPVRAAAEDAATASGKLVFGELKCNICHSIDSLGVERKSKSEKTKGPDLSTIGSDHDAAWLAKWLKQEVAAQDGKKHSKEWKGTPEQLQQVSTFLAGLKKK